MTLQTTAPLEGSAFLDALFRPRSVAVIGASSDPGKIGGMPVALLKTLGFDGQILPVNPKQAEIQGLPAWPSIDAIPGPVDLAIIAVPAAVAVDAVRAAADKGAKGAVVFSSGFAEMGEDGEREQRRMAEVARERGMRILGPNCLGFINVADKVAATFAPAVLKGLPPAGGVGLISQSGAFGSYAMAMARERGIGLSHWITTGNEGDLGFAECLEWLAEDPETKVVIGYMEGCRDGPRLRRALTAAARAGKPVIVLKVGRSEIGAAAAASHTAALAGEDAVIDGVLRQHGAIRASSIEECFDIAYATTICGIPQGNRAGLYTVSGGGGVLMADEAAWCGMEVPELSPQTQKTILDIVPFANARNPLDITGQMLNIEGAFKISMRAMMADGSCDVIVAFLAAAGLSPKMGGALVEDLKALRDEGWTTPIYAVTMAHGEMRKAFEASGCAVFEDANRAVRTAAAIARLPQRFERESQRKTSGGAARLDLPPAPTEPQALTALGQAGVPVMQFSVVDSPDAAAEAQRAIAAPVVVKIVSPDILHKSDIGGVKVGLTTPEATAEAAAAVLDAARRHVPSARIDGVMVARMESSVAECVIGVQRDPVFGPVVMFGMGGVHVESLKDVTFRAAPLTRDDALEMIDSIRAKRLLTHPRSGTPADVDALADLIVTVADLAVANADRIESLDLNPVAVRPVGGGVVALDALAILSDV